MRRLFLADASEVRVGDDLMLIDVERGLLLGRRALRVEGVSSPKAGVCALRLADGSTAKFGDGELVEIARAEVDQ